MSAPLAITGTGCLSRLGSGIGAHRDALGSPPEPFRLLGECPSCPAGFENLPAGWIDPRSTLSHRKWSPASAAALIVARQALEESGWSADDAREAAVFFGTSRGSTAGWLEPWPDRRPFALMAASNSLPAEPAAAIGHELGVAGAWQAFSSGCCAGLDALGMAALWLRAGLAGRALVVAVDLPLTGPVLDGYARTGLLASPDGPGMIPAEGAAALCLEPAAAAHANTPALLDYRTVSEPGDPLGAASSGRLTDLLREVAGPLPPVAVVPHASGTRAFTAREPDSIHAALGPEPSLHPLKPWTGHTIGASGLLETAIACDYLRRRRLPPIVGSSSTFPIQPGTPMLKIASAMGGKHSVVILQSPT